MSETLPKTSNANVVISQPMPNAPPVENIDLEKPGDPIEEKLILTQPMLNNESINDMLKRAEEEGEEKERQRQRNLDFCCFACADSCADTNDAFCWYFFCRMLCNGCGHCCECCANCTDSCCEGCASCCHDCCDGQGGCCDGCCDGDGGGDGCDGCCDCGDSGGCDCDCNCFD